MTRGRVLRLRLRLRLAALWREAALAIVEQVLKEQLLKAMLTVVRLLLTMTAGLRRHSAIGERSSGLLRRRDAARSQVPIEVKGLTEKQDMRMVVMRREGTACALGLAFTVVAEIATNKLAEEDAPCLRPA